MELNREQIIKALECCSSPSIRDCQECPYNKINDCFRLVYKNSLSLIKELTEENERLRNRNITLEQKFVILNREEAPILTVKVKGEAENEP